MSWARSAGGRTLIDVLVTPNAGRVTLSDTEQGLKLRVDAPPVDGEANARVIEFFARKVLRIPRAEVVVVSGDRARRKTLAVGLEAPVVDGCIQAWFDAETRTS